MNNAGQVAGIAEVEAEFGERPFRWSASTGMVPLGTNRSGGVG